MFNECAYKKIKARDTVGDPELKKVLMAAMTEEYDRNPDSVYLIMLAAQANLTEFTIL